MLLTNGKRIMKQLHHPIIYVLGVMMILAFFSGVWSIVINEVKIGNAIYGMYKYFRGFIYFFCTVALTNDKGELTAIRLYEKIYYINIIFVLFEYFILHLNQDLIGGIFGIIVGVNQYINFFFVIILVYIIVNLLYGTTKYARKKYLFFIVGMLAISAIAEIKYFYLEFLILLAFCLLLSKQKFKAMLIVVISLAGIGFFYKFLIIQFPEFATLASELFHGGLTRLVSLQRHYSTDYDIGRAVVFSYSNNYFLKTLVNRLFGLGMGAITSSSFVDNSFWCINQATHYDLFYTAYLYIEQGIIGFVIFCSFFAVNIIYGIISVIKNNNKYATMLIMANIGMILVFVYNMSIHSQLCFAGYYFVAVLLRKCINHNQTIRRKAKL